MRDVAPNERESQNAKILKTEPHLSDTNPVLPLNLVPGTYATGVTFMQSPVPKSKRSANFSYFPETFVCSTNRII